MATILQQRIRRPVFLNLFQIRLPVTAVVSFGHRVSGVVLALAVPFLVYLLQLSLRSAEGFAAATALFQHGIIRAIAVVIVWALAHHACAGVRHLLFDIHVGTSLHAARTGAWIVLLVELVVLVVAIGVAV